MVDIPSDSKKIRARLRSYERKLAEEKKRFGSYDDGAGKRYFVGPLYLLLGDQDGALKSFAWYEREFPDDIGDSGHYLCWALVLLRAGDEGKAKTKLRCAMLENRYTVPKLLGLDAEGVGVPPDRDGLALMYLEDIPEAYYSQWSDGDKAWAARQFTSDTWTKLRERFFEIEGLLENEPPGPRRTTLVNELYGMRR
jgi:hypothetical protein